MPGEFAPSSDFNAHLNADWKDAHKIWASVKAYIDALAVKAITPVDITGDLTWDGSQHTLDLTSRTAATARYAILSYYIDRDGSDFVAPLEFRTVGGSTSFIRNCGDQHAIDEDDGSNFYPRFGVGGIWVPLDAAQRVDYIAPAAYTTRSVYLLGYSGAI